LGGDVSPSPGYAWSEGRGEKRGSKSSSYGRKMQRGEGRWRTALLVASTEPPRELVRFREGLNEGGGLSDGK